MISFVNFEQLYCDLKGAFPHPMEWMGLLKRPPFWHLRRRKAYRKVQSIFASHNLLLSDRVALRFMLSDAQKYDEDAGGAIIRQLKYACDGLFTEIPDQEGGSHDVAGWKHRPPSGKDER